MHRSQIMNQDFKTGQEVSAVIHFCPVLPG